MPATSPQPSSADSASDAIGLRASSLAPRHPHPIFRRHPLSGSSRTSRGATVPTPFHAYAADGVVVYGTAERAAVTAIVQPSGFHPVTTSTGEGFAQLW